MCSVICCSLLVVSLGLFAFSQANGASKHQVATLSFTTVKAAPPHPPSQPRRFIDGAAGVLTAPFHGVVHSSSQWATRLATTILALLLYGLGLGYLARWART